MTRVVRPALAIFILIVMLGGPVHPRPQQEPREARGEYGEPTLGIAYPDYQMIHCETGCVVLDVLPGERYAHVLIDDDFVRPVAFKVFPWDGESRYIDGGSFCGKTDELVALPRWTQHLWIEPLIGPCSDGTPGTATRGVVIARLAPAAFD